MIKKLSFFLATILHFISFSQKLPTIKVDEIKAKGNNKIYYYLKDGYKYIPNTKIIDWYASIEKLTSDEEYNPKKTYFVEKCKFDGGVKNGEFKISILNCNQKETTSGFGTFYWLAEGQNVMSGTSFNNQLTGNVSILTFTDFDKTTGFLSIKYEFGKIANQIVSYPFALQFMNVPFDLTTPRDLNLSLIPQVIFENGVVKEITHIEASVTPYIKVFSAEGIHITKYTFSPICFNEYRFETPANIKEALKYNVNKYAIESYLYRSFDGSKKIEGEYRLFMPAANDKIFDTSRLVASYLYKNGSRNGLSRIWDVSKNGKKGELPYIEQNYRNDLLHGEAKLFFSDHKVAVQASFQDGYVIGEVNSYSNSSKYKVFSLDGIVRRTSDNGGVHSIEQINEKHDFNDELFETIKIIRDSKGTIKEYEDYSLYSKAFYILDSIKISSGKYVKFSKVKDYVSVYNSKFEILKKYYESTDPSKIKELSYIDETGKLVYSLSQAISDVNASKKILQNAADKINNQIVICHYCNVKAKFGSTVSNGDCNCVKTDRYGNKEKTSLYIREVWPFCSRKCLTEWEKSMCIKNGYSFE